MVLPEENNGIDCEHPDKRLEIIRYGSFQDWRRHHTDNRWPNDLARRGYFYDRNCEEIICFHCGMTCNEHSDDCEIDCCNVPYHLSINRPRQTLCRLISCNIQLRPSLSQHPEQNAPYHSLSQGSEAVDLSSGQPVISSIPLPQVAGPLQDQCIVSSIPQPQAAGPLQDQCVASSIPQPRVAGPLQDQCIVSSIPQPQAAGPLQDQCVASSIPQPRVAGPLQDQCVASFIPQPKAAGPLQDQCIASSIPHPWIAGPLQDQCVASFISAQNQMLYQKLWTRKDTFRRQGFINTDFSNDLALDGLYADASTTTIRCFCCGFHAPYSMLAVPGKLALDNILALHASSGSCRYSRSVKEIKAMLRQEPAATEGLGNNLHERGICIICDDHPAKTMYLPCRHIYSCYLCAEYYQHAVCLLCHCEIQGQQRFH